MTEKDVLQVKTLGDFVMTWQGKLITGGSRSADSHFTRLMQYLLHNQEKGLTRMQMQQLLSEDSSSEDVHHLLRSVIYNTRRKLAKAGLPESDYIEFREGTYYWTKDIPVEEDARRFEELHDLAEAETDPEERGRKFLEACYAYGGEFLPQQTRLLWVAQEETRYRLMFGNCVEEAAGYLREKKNWAEMENLGNYASKVCAFNEWETITVEALTAKGEYEEATKLLQRAAEYYQKELGMSFSLVATDQMGKCIAQMEHPESVPENIRQELLEAPEKVNSGYRCSYPVFQGIYRVLCRTMERMDERAYLMVCTLRLDSALAEDPKKRPNDDELKALSDRMEETIGHCIRKGDVVCRYSRFQFLIILFQGSVNSCRIVRNRISRSFREIGPDMVADFSMSPIHQEKKEE